MPSFVLVLIIAVLASGCASLTRDGSLATTLIRSNPPGAAIFVDGEKVGQTPELVEIARGRNPRFELDSSAGREEYILPTRYRWGASFASGFIFAIVYAPIAWAIDFLTGTAWDIRESDPIALKLSKYDLEHPKAVRNPPDAVIAPPRSASMTMSDDGGHALEKAIPKVRPYDQTLAAFLDHDYEYGSKDLNARRRLLKSLNTDLVYESYIEGDETGLVLISEIHEVRGVGITPGPTVRISRDKQGPRVFGVGFGLQPWWSRILPNTVGVDFAEEKLNFDLGGKNYEMQPVYGDEWWALGLRYASALNISSSPDRRRAFGSRWEFSAVPTFRFSRRTVKVVGMPPISGQFIEAQPEFTRWSIGGGYGLEIGYLVGRHFLYFDLIPVFQWSRIYWRQNGQDRDASRTAVNVRTELGYNYIFNSNWMLQGFIRSPGENTELWQDAFKSKFNDATVPTTVSNIITGVSVGYRFDTDRYQAETH